MAIKFKKVNSMPTNPTTADDGVYFVKSGTNFAFNIISGGAVIELDATSTGELATALTNYYTKTEADGNFFNYYSTPITDANDNLGNGVHITTFGSTLNFPFDSAVLIVQNDGAQRNDLAFGNTGSHKIATRRWDGGTPGTWVIQASEDWVQSQGFLTSYTETDPVFTASPAGTITNTDISEWNVKGTDLSVNQGNATVNLLDINGNILSTVNLGFLVSGTTIRYNETTQEIEFVDANGNVISSFPASELISGLAAGMSLTGATLTLTDNEGATVDTVTFTIANIQGLQAALDSKTPYISFITSLNGLSDRDVTGFITGSTIGNPTGTAQGFAISTWGGLTGIQWAMVNSEGVFMRTNTGLTDADYSPWEKVATQPWVQTLGFITMNDLTGYALQSWVQANFDNYQSWNLKTNGAQRVAVQSGGTLDLVAGTNTSIQYSAGGVVTINSSFDDTTYAAGTGLVLSGTVFSFDVNWGDARYITAEVNNLSQSVTWVNVPNAFITQSSVVQHEAALTIDWSQITSVPNIPNDNNLVHINGNETINNQKTFTIAPSALEDANSANELVRLSQMQTAVSDASVQWDVETW